MKFSRGYSLGLIFLFFALTGCYPWHSSSLSDVRDAEKDVQKAIKGGKLNTKTIDNAIEAYQFFIMYFPYDTVCPAFAYREGELYQMDGDYKKSVGTLNNLRSLYPTSPKVPDALFLIASIYEQNIKDQDSADWYYAKLLFDYPDSKAAQKTHTLLDSRGISSEDFYKKYVREFSKSGDLGRTDSTKKAIRYHAYWK